MAEQVIQRDPGGLGVLTEIAKRISWGAVFAGVMVALGMEVLFTLFGLFIGFGIYNASAANPVSGVSAWTTVWYLVTAGWSFFIGAWVAARLSGNPGRGSGVLHGLVTWGLTSITTFAVLALALSWVLGGSLGVMRTAVTPSAQVVGPAAAQAENTRPAQAQQAANQLQQQASQALGQAQQQAPSVSQAAANLLSGISLRLFGGTLLALITAIMGGLIGPPRLGYTEAQVPAAPTEGLAA